MKLRTGMMTLVFLCLVAGVLLSDTFFFVNQGREALVMQWGKPIGEARMPGLNVKLPFMQRVYYVDSRLLDFELGKKTSLTVDQKTFEWECYVCWRVDEPLLFVKSLGNEKNAEQRLQIIVSSKLGVAISNKSLQQVIEAIEDKRNPMMGTVLVEADKEVKPYGVSIIDVRMKRADVPESNRQAIFERMKAERSREATQSRSEGEADKLRIISQANLDKALIIAEAEKKSIIIRSEADAYAMQVLAGAIATSPKWYNFIKSLETYKASFKDNTRVVLSTDSDFLRIFSNN